MFWTQGARLDARMLVLDAGCALDARMLVLDAGGLALDARMLVLDAGVFVSTSKTASGHIPSRKLLISLIL
ncbi:hypothetical protein [Sporosarcina sp. SAFN-015]|uniref:hypothetical protein n=1 Tax=Sporosarcina sp. SAFN-015 TaxID=3387274 RepID=UPI003F7ED193